MFDLKLHAKNQALNVVAESTFDHMVEVLPEGQQGVASIDHFTISRADLAISLSLHHEEFVPEGTYARLKVNGQLMMTDTPMEKRTNLEVVEKARGRVLIAGLGLGMILRAILKKPEVTHITVLEKYQDVVDLVLPQFAAIETRLEVIVGDVFHWKPSWDTPKFDTIYFDIWPDSSVTHLPEMTALYRRYRPLLVKGGWMDSWTYRKLKQQKADDAKFLKKLPLLMEKHRKTCTPDEFSARLRVLLLDGNLNDTEKQVVREWARKRGINFSA